MSERKVAKHQPCKLCAQGVKLVGKEHWIVKSIIPARIKIVKCTSREALRHVVEDVEPSHD